MDTTQFLSAHSFVTDAREKVARHAAKRWRRRSVDDIKGMVWHQALSEGAVTGIAKYHVNPNHISAQGLPSISYTFFVSPEGDCFLCNDLEDVTLSQGDRSQPGDENRMYMAVCFGGNFDAPGYRGTTKLTTLQMHAGIRLWLVCKETFGWAGADLLGHYHMGKSVCPGAALASLIDTIRADPTAAAPNGVDLDDPRDRQEVLKRLGYYGGAVDGVWGLESRKALAKYQAACGLVVDGAWGPQTKEALSREL